MALIRINHHPTVRQLRVFTVAWLMCFGLLALVLRAKGHLPSAIWVAGGALAVPLVGLALPRLLRLVYLGMTYATFPIGWVLSHLILGVVYFLVLTPIGWVLRAFRYDPLSRGFDSTAATYWKSRSGSSPAERYFRQH
jgi:hypothetical protein